MLPLLHDRRNHIRTKALAIALGVCFLFVGTALTSTITHHALDNHHSQHTHVQSWCDWMCKAGQAIQAPELFIEQTSHHVTPLYLTLDQGSPSTVSLSSYSRGPPVPFAA